jgi:hypothetical protein
VSFSVDLKVHFAWVLAILADFGCAEKCVIPGVACRKTLARRALRTAAENAEVELVFFGGELA